VTISHSNIKLAQSLEERDTLVDKLEKKSEDFDRAQAVGNIGSWRLDVCKNELHGPMRITVFLASQRLLL